MSIKLDGKIESIIKFLILADPYSQGVQAAINPCIQNYFID
jgi:hypothetical protein